MTFVQKDKEYRSIIGIVIVVCAVMIFVESVLQPAYAVKSAVKLLLFLGSFFLCSQMFHCRVLIKNDHRKALKWFSFPVFILMVAGLFAAGLVLNFFCHYADSILGSWVIHIASNLAINTIGFMIL